MSAGADDVDHSRLVAAMDRSEIVEVACRYTWALDAKSWDLLDDVFTPDATADLGGVSSDGREAIKERIAAALGPLDVSQHLVGSHDVTVGPDGDAATHRCQLHAQHVRRAATDDVGPDASIEARSSPDRFVVAGIYDDRLVRTDGGWRIAHRTLTVTWTSGNPGVTRPTR